jgi:hypothetical protein
VVGAGGDDDQKAAAIDSAEEWCTEIKDADDRFETADNSGDPFDVKQDRYWEINATLHDLTDSIELVDADSRNAVDETIRWAITFTEVWIDANGEEAWGLRTLRTTCEIARRAGDLCA